MDATRPSAPWLAGLTDASAQTRRLVDELDESDLDRPSLAGDWTIAQVLSHLGSGAEICAELVRRGLAGDDRGPRREELVPIWDRWNALPPREQRARWRDADLAHLDLLSGIDAGQEAELVVPYFAGPMDLATYLGYRLSEHAVHGWDVAAAVDPAARLGQVDLVWQRIDLIASRFHDVSARAQLAPREVALEHGGRGDLLTVGEEVHIRSARAGTVPARLVGDTEVLARLVYGRLRDVDELTEIGRAHV